MAIRHVTVDAAKTNSADYTRMRDGVPHEQDKYVKPQLYEFARALEKAMRVKVIPRCNKTLHVYREGDLMIMGYIGYGDFATSVKSEDKFIVCARSIENNKYCSSGDQHNMRMALNMDTAVKHAKRNLMSYTIGECATALVDDASSAVKRVRSDATDEYDNATAKVGITTRGYGDEAKARDRVVAELRAMVQSGHTFVDKGLDADIRTMFSCQEEYNRFTNGSVPMDFVHIREQWGKQVVQCARIADVTGYHHQADMARTLSPDEISEDIQHKAAAMSMCEDGHFVEGIGYRVNANTFYFYV